ncbi:hypothetical protein AB0K48_56495, partial [Nonomuraea sp. NPDC055795]
KRNVPRKIWLHQGTHRDPFSLRAKEWLRQLHSWFANWLEKRSRRSRKTAAKPVALTNDMGNIG